MTTRPGLYDPDEYPATWEFQEIMRTRHVWEKKLDDGAVVIVDPGTEGATCMRVHDVASMKSTQTGFTEGSLNEIRYCAKHDPQNVIFSIDNAKQAGEVNEIRLQPTLRRLGEEVLPVDDDDVGRFIIKMRRMLVYFLGSYSAGAFTQKMCELGICDELEKHGSKTSADELRGRMKSSPRRLCVLMSRPEKVGGPIDKEHKKGSMHELEVPCPRCTEKNSGILTGFQVLEQDQMKFGHCRNLLGELDKDAVMRDTFFECVHCGGRINESEKRWLNDRKRRRWRRTNMNADPNFISFHVSDFLSYDESVCWGRLAIKYHGSKGDPVARQTYRNEHEGLPYEVRASKTEAADIMLLRGKHTTRPDSVETGRDHSRR
jgi:phage terminase large subunit GpA-like protein